MNTTKTNAEHEENPYFLSVPEAGRKYYGIGRGASYEAAKRGDIPTMRVGRKLIALVQVLERKLSGVE